MGNGMPDEAARKRFEEAIAEITQNRPDRAQVILEGLLAEEPDYVEARLALGVLMGGKGDPKEARRHLRLAMEQLGTVPRVGSEGLRAQVLVNLCSLALEEGDWEDVYAWESAFEDVREGLQHQGLLEQSASTLFDAANRAVRVRQIDKARTLYERAVSLDPDFGEVWYNLAVLASEDGELEDAIAFLQKAVEAEPTFADAQFLLGTLLLPTDPESAIEYMEQAITLEPTNARWITLLGSAYARQHRFEKARELFARSLQLDDAQADAHLGFAVASRALGDMETARFALRRAFELNPQLAAQIQQMMDRDGNG